jgi:hypothetical protein
MIVSLFALVVALGGVGIAANGGPFLLGTVNNATALTTLSTSVPGRAMKIVNSNTAGASTALGLFVAEGHAPFTVNSDKRVASLNADLLDDLHANDLVRVGRAFDQNFFSVVSTTSKAEVTLDVPVPGFVLLVAQANAQTTSSTCNPCFLHMHFRNLTTSVASPTVIGSVGNGSGSTQATPIATTWIYAVEPGERTFALETGVFPGSAAGLVSTRNPAISALFVPFANTGTRDFPDGVPRRNPAAKPVLGPMQRNGTREVLRWSNQR